MVKILKHGIVFIVATFFQALSNYLCFGIASSLGYAGKTNSIIFKMLEVIGQMLWLPLGVLQFTKFWYVLEWNYPAMLVVNSFLAVGIIYLLIFLKKPLLSKIIVFVVTLFLLWFILIVLGASLSNKQ